MAGFAISSSKTFPAQMGGSDQARSPNHRLHDLMVFMNRNKSCAGALLELFPDWHDGHFKLTFIALFC